MLDADLLQHLLKHCAPPHTAHPAVLWRCAVSAAFLREAVREVPEYEPSCPEGGDAQMESAEGKDADLAELRRWKVS